MWKDLLSMYMAHSSTVSTFIQWKSYERSFPIECILNIISFFLVFVGCITINNVLGDIIWREREIANCRFQHTLG